MLKLRLLTGPRAGRQLRVSDTKPISIGRRKGRLRLHDSRVSKNHAEICFENGLWVLRDLDSANGTYVNRREVAGLVELEPGDHIQMGRVLMKIVRCDAIGMDTLPTAPEMTDEASTLEPRVSPDAAQPSPIDSSPFEVDDDLDLDALFEDSAKSDGEPSFIDDVDTDHASATEPIADDQPTLQRSGGEARDLDDEAAAEELDVPDRDASDESSVAPSTFAIQDAEDDADDDDSFFADLGVASVASDDPAAESDRSAERDTDAGEIAQDAPDQIEVDTEPEVVAKAVEENIPEAIDDAPDPFLAPKSERDDDTTDDLISLDEESKPSGEQSGGTTLLTAAREDDAAVPQAADDIADESPQDEGDHEAHADRDLASKDEDEDDAPPALVGLALEHAPPLQPIPEPETEAQAEADVAAESEPAPSAEPEDIASAPLERAVDGDETLDPARDASVQEINDALASGDTDARPDTDAQPDTESDTEADLQEPMLDRAQAEALSDSAFFDAIDLHDDEDAATEADTQPRADAEPDAVELVEPDPSAIGATSPLGESDEAIEPIQADATDDALDAHGGEGLPASADLLDEEGPRDASESLGSAEDRDESQNAAQEPTPAANAEPDALAQADAAAEDATASEDDFDIDAAFDALSEGLDDSIFGMPTPDHAIAADFDQADAADNSDDAVIDRDDADEIEPAASAMSLDTPDPAAPESQADELQRLGSEAAQTNQNDPDDVDDPDDVGEANDRDSTDSLGEQDAAETDSLVGSQLDVGFIRDALTRLDDQADADAEASQAEDQDADERDDDYDEAYPLGEDPREELRGHEPQPALGSTIESAPPQRSETDDPEAREQPPRSEAFL